MKLMIQSMFMGSASSQKHGFFAVVGDGLWKCKAEN